MYSLIVTISRILYMIFGVLTIFLQEHIMNDFINGRNKENNLSHENAPARPNVEPGKTLSEEESWELLQEMKRQLAEFMTPEDGKKRKKPRSPDVEILFSHGTFQQQIEMQMALLTQAVASCMLHASGAGRDLEEESQSSRGSWGESLPIRASARNWPQIRSLQLHDAARLAEAAARLVNGYAKFRGHMDQQFSLRHSASHDKKGKRQRVSTITHRFTAPRDEAIPDAQHLRAEINNDLYPKSDT